MYSNKRTNQGGSVAVFLIVSVLLAVAVVGGMYAVQKRGSQAREVQPIAQTPTNEQKQETNNQAQEAEQQKQAAEAEKQAETQKKAAADKQAQADAQKKAEADKKAQADAEKKRQEAAQKAGQAPAPAATIPQTGVTSQPTDKLPTTGPESNLMQLLAGGVLVAMVGAYLKSYRYRFGSVVR
jgi:LPXTG-motif cell wall-anchored protein